MVISNWEIQTSKIDYYTWKIGAIVLLFLLLFIVGFKQGSWGMDERQAEINDNYWHMGYSDCIRYYNFTVDEMYVLNKYRLEKIQNDTKRN